MVSEALLCASLHERTSALLERKNVVYLNSLPLTSDNAVTCQNVPGSPSAIRTKIVRTEEGEPGDEATIFSLCFEVIEYGG